MVMDDGHNAATRVTTAIAHGADAPIGEWSDLGRLVRRRAANAAATHRDLMACLSKSGDACEGASAEANRGQDGGGINRPTTPSMNADGVSYSQEGKP